MDEHGAWRRAVVRRLPPALTQGPHTSWQRSRPVCSSTERGLSQAREKATVIFSRVTAVGFRLHLERKP